MIEKKRIEKFLKTAKMWNTQEVVFYPYFSHIRAQKINKSELAQFIFSLKINFNSKQLVRSNMSTGGPRYMR
jgi:hypothetical protein